jgi:flagellar hook assembly protein FlgD
VTDTTGTDTLGTDTLGTDTLGDSSGLVSLVEVGNHPNPFNPTTTISFSLTAPAQTSLFIYDILGRKVKSFEMSRLPTGRHEVQWNGENEAGAKVASGVYLYRLVAGSKAVSRKMVLLK